MVPGIGETGTSRKVMMAGCANNCGGACLLKIHVADGVITKIETDDGPEPQLRACLRGRAYRQRIYAPDRILHPLKRVGQRGEGKFERISWEEAFGTVASEYKRVKDVHGSAAVIFSIGGGDLGRLHWQGPMLRAFSMAGGCSRDWGGFSYEGALFAALATYGTDLRETWIAPDDLVNSRLAILWSINLADTVFGAGTAAAMARARETGTRFIVVDPRFTNTAAALADRWVPIRPGGDVAVMLAMAYVMISENILDRRFLDTYTVGFDRFQEYVLGREDGVAKTPYWAEPLSDVPPLTVAELAREYATDKPAALMAGWAAGRSAIGEQYHRAAFALTAMTGNIGIHGGGSGGTPGPDTPGSLLRLGLGMKPGKNPVEIGSQLRPDALKAYGGAGLAARTHRTRVADAILRGKASGYPSDYKMLYLANYNWLNQLPNVNKGIQALKSLEFIAVQEQFMTSTARFADVILPTSTFLERADVKSGPGPHLTYTGKAIEPLGEARSHLEIAAGLAETLGIVGYNDKSDDEWLREIVAPVISDYEDFKKAGVRKFQLGEVFVPFKKQIEDPEKNPFRTPSGKIEIYSHELEAMNNPLIPPIPKYIETWESRNDPLSRKYPLQLVSPHYKRRNHSQFGNLPWLRELDAQVVTINSADAGSRGINDGDLVRVFNDRGEIIVPVRVTERIMPGVVDVPQGAMYSPNENGVDIGGCANVLTRDEPSPGGAFPYNTCLVQVQKV